MAQLARTCSPLIIPQPYICGIIQPITVLLYTSAVTDGLAKEDSCGRGGVCMGGGGGERMDGHFSLPTAPIHKE